MNRRDLDRSIIDTYTDQPCRLPETIRTEVERLWEGQPVQLYALADLDAGLSLDPTWVVLGPKQVVLVQGENGNATYHRIDRARVREVRETTALSCHVLTLVPGPDEAPLAVLRYTHRQRRAMDNIRVVLEQDREETPPLKDSADDLYAASVAEPIREAQASVSGRKLAIVWRLCGYLKPYRKEVTLGFATAIIMTVVSLFPPYLTGFIIDRISDDLAAEGSVPAGTVRVFWMILLGLAVVYLVRVLCLWIRMRKMAMLGEHVAHDLRKELYGHLQTLSLRFFSRKQTGSIISRVSSDTDRLWDFIAFGIVEVSISVVMLIGLGVVLLWMDWRLGLVMTVPVPLFLWGFYAHGRKIGRVFLKGWRKWSHLTSILSGTIPGMRVVKAFNQEEREVTRFGGRNAECLHAFNQVHRVWTAFWPQLIFGFHAMTILVWALALPRITGTGGTELSPGTFVAFLLYTGMFMHPLEVIGQMTRMMNRAVTSAYRIFEVLDTEPQITNVTDPVLLTPLQGEIQFDDVSFSYDGVRTVIKDITFTVNPGEMIGLVGPSGAGKSTITNLIARFYDATDGCVRIDGTDVRQLDVGHYRRQIGMVLQDPYLFHGTIIENIAYGMEDAELAQVIKAAQAANAHEFICGLAQGYETMVGERGQTLSGGERQRISIARAILHDPSILILDEATSNVDTETERNIQTALQRLVKGRTVIAIAHRLSTLKRADRLLVIKDGKLAESGTHAELLDLEDGVFRKLHEMQQELHEQFAV